MPRLHLPRLLAAIAASFLIASCAPLSQGYIVGDRAQRRELGELFTILDRSAPEGKHPDAVAEFAAARSISALLLSQGEHSLSASFLLAMADDPGEFTAWYLFAAAASYEAGGDPALAIPLYERIVKTTSDRVVDGVSLHYEALTRLVNSPSPPEIAIERYRDLIARFPDAPEIGAAHFLLGKEYEKAGMWKEALASFTSFLPYFGSQVPAYPDAFEYARNLVEFNASRKDWTQPDLAVLVADIRKALAAGSARQLRKYAAKAGFFARSWYQDGDTDANSKVAFDLNQFMQNKAIRSSETLHPSSGPYEAYLRTWGWAGRGVPVWYLYFRKVDFPADPSVHGNWEWAGIYFGEKMQ